MAVPLLPETQLKLVDVCVVNFRHHRKYVPEFLKFLVTFMFSYKISHPM